MVQFILVYASLLILAAFICNGLYSITRGWWSVNPDGTSSWKGKIFNKFHYWLQRHTIEYKPYENNEWLKILNELKPYFDRSKIISISENYLLVKPMTEVEISLFFAYAESKRIKVNVNIVPSETKEKTSMIVAYKEVNKYVLPEYIRYPLGECLSCMGSVWGSILWVFFYNLLPELGYIVLHDLPIFYKIGLWLTFIITLSFLNELVFNINYSKSK